MKKSMGKVYCRQIFRQLSICRKHDRNFYRHIKTNINAYLLEFPDATYDNLVSEFGTPESVVNNYIELQEPTTIRKQTNGKSRFITITVSLTVIISVGIGGYYYWHTEVCKAAASAPIIVEEETVTIIYDSKYTEDMEE